MSFSALQSRVESVAQEVSRQCQSISTVILSHIPNPRTLAQLPLLTSPITNPPSLQRSRQTASCPNAQLSCHNTSAIPNTCCFNAPGGQLLQTQFWDVSPAVGPMDSWTIHGLWPDHCDGGFDQYCDSKRSYSNISEILESFGETGLLGYMKIFWKDYQGTDPMLWSHEWSKHGTCVSTLETSCYTDYVSQEEVVDYFEKTVKLFKTLPTYSALSAAGIVPSESNIYPLADIQSTLKQMHGASVTLGCRNGALDEVWYHFDVRGSVQSGQFVAAEPDGLKSSCPSTVKYLPKDPLSIPTPTANPTTTARHTAKPTSTSGPGKPFTGAGFLEVMLDESTTGCLISDGSWYTSGTCATYHAEEDPTELFSFAAVDDDRLFTLTSSKGPCGFLNGAFSCGRNVPKQDIFSGGEDGYLALKKNTTFFADGKPGHAKRAKVYADQGDHEVMLQLQWKGK